VVPIAAVERREDNTGVEDEAHLSSASGISPISSEMSV
jgi:hypothetical protein